MYVCSIIPTALLRYVAIFQARFQSPEMSELCSVGGNNSRTTSGLSGPNDGTVRKISGVVLFMERVTVSSGRSTLNPNLENLLLPVRAVA